ncbi:hypothetical protein EXS71_02140 [Candidatus Uhrbacteria bacterium]|nr:hypothetical protein [Candidatus Uhrbacteria bacterium]
MMRLLEMEAIELPMEQRVLQAVDRLQDFSRTAQVGGVVTYALRGDQVNVFNDFAIYMRDVASRSSEGENDLPMGRIILPPRTGKTVIAAHSINVTGLTTAFMVPSKALVDQTAAEFRQKLPDIPIGTYYGDEKNLVNHGVNVTTYSILQHQWRRHECLPAPIRHAALVFPDEAHHSMTKQRLAMLRFGFDPRAIRIALTASPDYSDERKLSRFFPQLIHQITIEEAVKLDLLAPTRVFIYEVDVDASKVEFKAGDFEDETTGRLMSAAPFLEAACKYRYQAYSIGERALICCRSRQQAYDLYKYLLAHRPEGTPAPGLIIQDTSTSERREILRKYELGFVDTLITVSILVEGWSSPFCKVLIDLAPSLSLVRATQKFFRPMTRWAEHEAKIYILLPKNLSVQPVLPMEIMNWSQETYESGALIASPERQKCEAGELEKLKRHAETPVAHVRLKTRVLVNTHLQKPALNSRDTKQVQQVLRSNSEFSEEGDELPSFFLFRWLMFTHQLFTGRGDQLLRYLGVPLTQEGYVLAMARVFPETANDRFLLQRRNLDTIGTCYDELEAWNGKLLKGMGDTRRVSPAIEYGYCALAGPIARGELPNGEDVVHAQELHDSVNKVLATLTPRLEKLLRLRFGIDTGEEMTLEAVGREFEINRERVRQIEARAFRLLRHPSRSKYLKRFLPY